MILGRGHNLGVYILAYTGIKPTWWTSDSPNAIKAMTREEADQLLKKLKYNNPRIVTQPEAFDAINEQHRDIDNPIVDDDPSWDAHKDTF